MVREKWRNVMTRCFRAQGIPDHRLGELLSMWDEEDKERKQAEVGTPCICAL